MRPQLERLGSGTGVRSRQRRRLPREAREGLMRAWLEILRERHPGVDWLPTQSGAKRR
jgi:hypothetical protein